MPCDKTFLSPKFWPISKKTKPGQCLLNCLFLFNDMTIHFTPLFVSLYQDYVITLWDQNFTRKLWLQYLFFFFKSQQQSQFDSGERCGPWTSRLLSCILHGQFSPNFLRNILNIRGIKFVNTVVTVIKVLGTFSKFKTGFIVTMNMKRSSKIVKFTAPASGRGP